MAKIIVQISQHNTDTVEVIETFQTIVEMANKQPMIVVHVDEEQRAYNRDRIIFIQK